MSVLRSSARSVSARERVSFRRAMNFFVLMVGIRVPSPGSVSRAGASLGKSVAPVWSRFGGASNPERSERLPQAPAARLVRDLRGESLDECAPRPLALRLPLHEDAGQGADLGREPLLGGREERGRKGAGPEDEAPEGWEAGPGAGVGPARRPAPRAGRAGGRRAREDLPQERRPRAFVGDLLGETTAEVLEVGGLLRRLPDEERGRAGRPGPRASPLRGRRRPRPRRRVSRRPTESGEVSPYPGRPTGSPAWGRGGAGPPREPGGRSRRPSRTRSRPGPGSAAGARGGRGAAAGERAAGLERRELALGLRGALRPPLPLAGHEPEDGDA